MIKREIKGLSREFIEFFREKAQERNQDYLIQYDKETDLYSFILIGRKKEQDKEER